jgi:nitroreductase
MFALIGLALSAPAVPATIELATPDTTRGLTFAKTLANRHSERSFKTTPLPLQDLSDLVWSVYGINRPSNGHLTIPTATNSQDLSIYVYLPAGVYLYDNKKNVLTGVLGGDHRADLASVQTSVQTAPVFLLIVSDYSKFTGLSTDEAKKWSAFDAGVAVQTAVLWASANGYVACPRALMDNDKVHKSLNLKTTQLVHLNVPVGLQA